jgi:hypothetical protein
MVKKRNIVMKLTVRIIVLFTFWKLISNIDYIKKYKNETQFSVYRSLMCSHFTFMALENVINNFSSGIKDVFHYKNKSISKLNKLFVAYLIFDLFMMVYLKISRIDLFIHHGMCLIIFFLANKYNYLGYFSNVLLINEAISIVSGFDKIFLEEKQLDKSVLCKKYRLFVIKYIRLPIWIISIFIIIKNNKEIPLNFFWLGLGCSFIMILLDNYWKNKCLKAIKKSKNAKIIE